MNNMTYSVMKPQRMLGQKCKLDLSLRDLLKVTVLKYVILEGMSPEPQMRVSAEARERESRSRSANRFVQWNHTTVR
jgi:hypothetical protein